MGPEVKPTPPYQGPNMIRKLGQNTVPYNLLKVVEVSEFLFIFSANISCATTLQRKKKKRNFTALHADHLISIPINHI